jgi:hypothetical protein
MGKRNSESVAVTKEEAKALKSLKHGIEMQQAWGLGSASQRRTADVTLEEFDKLRSLVEKGLISIEVCPSWRDTHVA